MAAKKAPKTQDPCAPVDSTVKREPSPCTDVEKADKPRQAIILAAGRASQLRPYTDTVPTALINIADKPMVQHNVEALRRQGVDRFVICRGWQGSAFDKVLADLGEGVVLVDCPNYTSTGMLESMKLAMSRLEAGGFYVVYGDIIFRPSVARQLAECISPISIVVNPSLQGKTVADIEVVTTSGESSKSIVRRVGKGRCPNPAQASGEFGGIVKFAAAGREVVENIMSRIYPKFGGSTDAFEPNMRLPWWLEPVEKASICDLLQLMCDEGKSVAPVWIYGGWHEVNKAEDLTRVWNDTAMFLSEADVRAQVSAMGACLLSEANDLKRPLPIVSKEINVSLPKLEALLKGNLDISDALEILRKMSETYPVPLNDLWLEADDTVAGVRLCKRDDGFASRRVLDRADRHGNRTPYYEYRDCAMSRCAPFRPEWIKELRVVTSGEANDPDIAMNSGHLMMQTTLFLGPVDFYWKDRHGVVQRRAMNSGDSNFISSFVPHTFTCREEGKEAIIIAVTYGGRVRGAFTEFARIGAMKIDTLCGDKRDGASMRSSTVKRLLQAECMSEKFLATAVAGKLTESRVSELVAGQEGTFSECEILAEALNVHVSLLLGKSLTEEEEVVVTRTEDSHKEARRTGTYVIAPMARTVHQPDLKTFDFEVLESAQPGETLSCGLHTFIYHFGTDPVELRWQSERNHVTQHNVVTLTPGDSAYVSPLVDHSFSTPAASVGVPATKADPCKTAHCEGRRLLVIRIAGHLTGETLSEFATYVADGKARVGAETQRWYN